ncbi:hypothetical protein C8Q80DRAFT_858122 [Daedaleopsis nitida]|nr:hypothetical protein C8Q80DRAFT_858122 [Daedaleopsis nitida]
MHSPSVLATHRYTACAQRALIPLLPALACRPFHLSTNISSPSLSLSRTPLSFSLSLSLNLSRCAAAALLCRPTRSATPTHPADYFTVSTVPPSVFSAITDSLARRVLRFVLVFTSITYPLHYSVLLCFLYTYYLRPTHPPIPGAASFTTTALCARSSPTHPPFPGPRPTCTPTCRPVVSVDVDTHARDPSVQSVSLFASSSCRRPPHACVATGRNTCP